MEITATRTGAQLILTLAGRMDGTGAQEVSRAVRQNLSDHDTVMIFDLGSVDYLSSAGLRLFQESARKMKERNGRIAVCRVQDFVRKLFTSGGFFRLFSEYPSVDDAVAAMAGTGSSPAPGKKLDGSGWTLEARHLAPVRGTLLVTGNQSSIHAGKITGSDVQELDLSPDLFCAGTGALAGTREIASPLLGEMVQAGGSVYWIPTDGNLTPDFFTAQDLASSGMKAYALYMASFAGPFSDILRISSEKPDGMTLAEVYSAVFSYLRDTYPDFSGVCAVVLKATISGLCTSDLKTSILTEAAGSAARGPSTLPFGRTATEIPRDSSVQEKVSAVDVKPKYAGMVLLAVGYGVDTAAVAGIPPETLATLTYADPRMTAGTPFLYTKGIVFESLPWDSARPFEEQVRAAPAAGGFAAMHNILAISTLRSAVAGVIPIFEVKKGA